MSPNLALLILAIGLLVALNALGLLVASTAAKAHARRVARSAGHYLDRLSSRPERGAFGVPLGRRWIEEGEGKRVDVVAYRFIGSKDVVLWQRWLFVQVRPRRGRAMLCRGHFPVPLVDIDEGAIRLWMVGLAKRLDLLGDVRPFVLERQAWEVAPGIEPTEEQQAAMRALAPAATVWARDGVATAAFVRGAAVPDADQLRRYIDALGAL